MDFTLFKSLLMLELWVFAFTIIFPALFDPIGIIIYFLEESLVVILSLHLSFWLVLLIALWISETLLIESFRKHSWFWLLSRSLTVDSILFSLFFFIFLYFTFLVTFLFLEQLGLRLIGHAVTSVTSWWPSHKTDHET